MFAITGIRFNDTLLDDNFFCFTFETNTLHYQKKDNDVVQCALSGRYLHFIVVNLKDFGDVREIDLDDLNELRIKSELYGKSFYKEAYFIFDSSTLQYFNELLDLKLSSEVMSKVICDFFLNPSRIKGIILHNRDFIMSIDYEGTKISGVLNELLKNIQEIEEDFNTRLLCRRILS